MGKFVLKNIKDRIIKFKDARKLSIGGKAIANANFSLNQQYKLFFWCINEFVSGKPNSRARLVWNSLLINVVDKETVCDDEGWVSVKLHHRVKLLGKLKVLDDVDINWIDTELRDYFEYSFNKQVSNITDGVKKLIFKGKISKAESKIASELYFNNKNSLRSCLK